MRVSTHANGVGALRARRMADQELAPAAAISPSRSAFVGCRHLPSGRSPSSTGGTHAHAHKIRHLKADQLAHPPDLAVAAFDQ